MNGTLIDLNDTNEKIKALNGFQADLITDLRNRIMAGEQFNPPNRALELAILLFQKMDETMGVPLATFEQQLTPGAPILLTITSRWYDSFKHSMLPDEERFTIRKQHTTYIVGIMVAKPRITALALFPLERWIQLSEIEDGKSYSRSNGEGDFNLIKTHHCSLLNLALNKSQTSYPPPFDLLLTGRDVRVTTELFSGRQAIEDWLAQQTSEQLTTAITSALNALGLETFEPEGQGVLAGSGVPVSC